MNKYVPRKIKKMSATNPTLTERIQSLPPELREMILKEHITQKLEEREALGWYDVYYEILYAPVCEKLEKLVKVIFCCSCDTCKWNGLCASCFINGEYHYIAPHFLSVADIDEIFLKCLSAARSESRTFYDRTAQVVPNPSFREMRTNC